VVSFTILRSGPAPRTKGFVLVAAEAADGLMNVIVKPDVYQRYYKVQRNCLLLMVEETVQRQGGILNVLAEGAVGIG